MTFDYQRRQRRATRLIKKMGNPALLKTTTSERECFAYEVMISPTERRSLIANADSVYLVAAEGLSTPPDQDNETLVILDRSTREEIRWQRMVTPPIPFAPAGINIYWELNTQGQARG